MKPTKTDAALAMVDAGATPYAAAKAQGVSTSAVYRAMRRREERNLCPCCGQVVREGFEVVKLPAPKLPKPTAPHADLAVRSAVSLLKLRLDSLTGEERTLLLAHIAALLEGGN